MDTEWKRFDSLEEDTDCISCFSPRSIFFAWCSCSPVGLELRMWTICCTVIDFVELIDDIFTIEVVEMTLINYFS
jgi:hypothetical protein